MEINWFTVIAQVINFLILVWLLKRFLYKPVLNAIDEREKKIEAQLMDAEARKAAAQKEHDAFEQKNKALDQQRVDLLNKVQQEANSEKQRLFEIVRNESNALRSKYETSLKQAEEGITDMLKRKMQDEVFAIAGKTLSDLGSVNLEELFVQVFIKKLRELKDEERIKFNSALRNADKIILIKSAFQLPDPSKTELEKVIWELTENGIKFQYQVKPQLVSGIEIDAESYTVSWNIDSYLDSLKKNIADSLNGKFKEKENATL